MRLLHTADWHLGKRLGDFPRHAEQCEIMDEICGIAEREEIDAVIIAGDLFDTFNPPSESVELFYKTLKRLSNNGKRAVIAIAGNHDSPDRIEAPDPLARECGIIFAGYPDSELSPFKLESGLNISRSDKGFIELNLPGISYPLRILITSYANEYRLKQYLGEENQENELRNVLQLKWKTLADKYCDDKGVNVLLTHLFVMQKDGEVQAEPDDEKPILHVGGAQAIYTENIPESIQYTALGHLHRKQTIRSGESPVMYSGSPLSYSFSEAEQTKYVIIADIEPAKEAIIKEIPLEKGKKLIRKRAESVEEAVDWLNDNPDSLIELTMATETFLSAVERKQIYSAHDGILALIPEVRLNGLKTGASDSDIDLSKNIEELFKDYFRYKNSQEPDKRILELLREVIAGEDKK